MDAEERVTGWNPAAAELFGHSADEAVGRQVDELVFGDGTATKGATSPARRSLTVAPNGSRGDSGRTGRRSTSS